MKKRSKSDLTVLAIICAVFVVSGVAAVAKTGGASLFAARPDIRVKLSGSVNRGQAQLPVEKAEAVGSGEVVNWTISSSNVGEGIAHDYKTVGQIPKGTVFVEGSAKADGHALVTYSIDGGKTFTATPTISEKQPDGTMKQVAAPTSMYTQIQYDWSDPLAAGGKVTASYQVRVK